MPHKRFGRFFGCPVRVVECLDDHASFPPLFITTGSRGALASGPDYPEARRDGPGREGTLQHVEQIELGRGDCNQVAAFVSWSRSRRRQRRWPRWDWGWALQRPPVEPGGPKQEDGQQER